MKKILFILAFLPFVSFGDLIPDDDLVDVYPYRFNATGAFNNSVTYDLNAHLIPASSLSDYFFNYSFGVKINSAGTLQYPIIPSTGSGSITNASKTEYYNIKRISDSSWYSLVKVCPEVRSYASICSRLFLLGYSGDGINTVFTNSSGVITFNVFPVRVFSDVLSSTNTVFRRYLVESLSNINSSVQNIELNVSGLQSSIDHGNNFLSNISQNTTSALSSLSDISQSSSSSSSSLSQVSSNTAVCAFSLSQVSSNTAASVSSLSDISGNTASSAFSLSQVSSNTAASVSALSDISVNTAASASDLSYISDNSSSMASDLGSIKSDTYYLHGDVQELLKQGRLNSYLGAALSGNGLPDPDNPFFPYDPNNPDDPNHPDNPNSPWNPNSPNSLAGGGSQGAFTTNNVVKPITNTVKQASAEIQSNAVENADRQIDNANQNWQEFKDLATGDGDGLNVRIKYPIWGQDGSAVHVHDESLDNLISAAGDISSALDALVNSSSSSGGVTNYLVVVTNLLSDILASHTNSYLLLDNYADYISNGVYSASIGVFSDEFPNVYSNLLKYGLSADGNGNFWSLFGANLLYQSGLIGSLLDDMALVRNFADEHIEGGFTEGVKKIIDSFPSPTQLEDFLSSASNQLSQIESSTNDFLVAFTSLTNATSSVFDPFKGEFDSPPDGLVFFKTGNDQYVTIPVREQLSVWSTLRLGFSFGLVAVNLLLFPKFILLLVKLFSRLYNRYVKFVPEE